MRLHGQCQAVQPGAGDDLKKRFTCDRSQGQNGNFTLSRAHQLAGRSTPATLLEDEVAASSLTVFKLRLDTSWSALDSHGNPFSLTLLAIMPEQMFFFSSQWPFRANFYVPTSSIQSIASCFLPD